MAQFHLILLNVNLNPLHFKCNYMRMIHNSKDVHVALYYDGFSMSNPELKIWMNTEKKSKKKTNILAVALVLVFTEWHLTNDRQPHNRFSFALCHNQSAQAYCCPSLDKHVKEWRTKVVEHDRSISPTATTDRTMTATTEDIYRLIIAKMKGIDTRKRAATYIPSWYEQTSQKQTCRAQRFLKSLKSTVTMRKQFVQ